MAKRVKFWRWECSGRKPPEWTISLLAKSVMSPLGLKLSVMHLLATLYNPQKPMVFAGLYPADGEEFSALRDALGKLSLNDAAINFQQESSNALGSGFRCGFLGLLHMDIVQERLEREYELNLLATSPSVAYQVVLTDGTVQEIDNPAQLPSA